uniref:MTH1187 family thiamine-binding protein n=1 Tax=Archaeoglobus fulgidus TaxID=2234 RepID=A0A7C3VKL0_ARCFL
MIVEVSAVPVGVGESLSGFIAKVIEVLKKENIEYFLSPMGTSFEVESFVRLAEILEKIDRTLFEAGSPRNYYVIKIDSRAKGGRMSEKIRSVEEKLKQ